MSFKKYIVLWESPDGYWQGGGCIGDRESAERFDMAELPDRIQKRSLYRVGDRPPLSWKYVSTCGTVAVIEEV